jgi:hypothetical protein
MLIITLRPEHCRTGNTYQVAGGTYLEFARDWDALKHEFVAQGINLFLTYLVEAMTNRGWSFTEVKYGEVEF